MMEVKRPDIIPIHQKIAFPNNWPLTLTFEFTEQPRIDYCSFVIQRVVIY